MKFNADHMTHRNNSATKVAQALRVNPKSPLHALPRQSVQGSKRYASAMPPGGWASPFVPGRASGERFTRPLGDPPYKTGDGDTLVVLRAGSLEAFAKPSRRGST